MFRVCPLFLPAMLAIGCGRVGFDGSQLRDGAADNTDGAIDSGGAEVALDGAIDAPPDAAAMIRTVRTDTPTTVNAAAIVSSPLPLTAGNVVIAAPYWNDQTHSIRVTDSSGMTWRSIERQSAPQRCGGGTNLQMFYATVPSSRTVRVTATQPEGAGNMGLFVVEYSGLAADPLDGSVGSPATRVSNTMTTGMLTTTSFDVLVAAFHDSSGSGTMIPGPGFEVLAIDDVSYSLIADRQAEPGSHEATARLPDMRTNDCWVASMIALRAR